MKTSEKQLLAKASALKRIGCLDLTTRYSWVPWVYVRPVVSGSINPKRMSLAQIGEQVAVLEKQRTKLLSGRRVNDRRAQRQASALAGVQ